MQELRRFQRDASMLHAAAIVATSGLVLFLQQGRIVTGIVAGGRLGMANLSWMVGTASRLARARAGPRAHTLPGFIRFLAVGALLGGLLVVGRPRRVGSGMGFGRFP